MLAVNIFENEKNTQTFSAGQKIFNEGDPGETMFVVLEGIVDILKQDKVINTILAGNVFGEMALIDRQPRSASAVARENTKIAAIDAGRFMILVQHNPFFALEMMQVLTQRIRKSMES